MEGWLCSYSDDHGMAVFLRTSMHKVLFVSTIIIIIMCVSIVLSVFLFVLQKLKLTDNMIFLLAGLPKESYTLLLEIFISYEQSINSKKYQTAQSKPDCRGSNFRELRNLDSASVSTLLAQVRDGEIALSHLNKECKKIKRTEKLKHMFATEVGVESWEQAVHKFPRHATDAALERFIAAPKLAGPVLAAFQQYCSRAIRMATSAPPEGCRSSQGVELTIGGSTYCGIHLALTPDDITYQGIVTVIPQCSGFPLVIMHLSGHTDEEVGVIDLLSYKRLGFVQ